MKLILKIVSPSGVELERVNLKQNSVTIGRNTDNIVVLEDPKRYISAHHATIEYRSPDYLITDISTNGVFLNDSSYPIGNGKSAILNDGDHLNIGDYLIDVQLVEEKSEKSVLSPESSTNEVADFSDDPFSDLTPDPVQQLIDDNQLVPSEWKDKESEPDPLNNSFSDDFNSTGKGEYGDRGSGIKQPAGFKEAFQPYKAENIEQKSQDDDIFSENWFEESREGTDRNSNASLPEDYFSEKNESIETQSEITPVNQHNDELVKHVGKNLGHEDEALYKTNDHYAEIIDNFLSGAGLENSEIKDSLTPETFNMVGKILRASVQGTMDVLAGRAKIKNEMHLDVTMIRSAENNPIKFSVSAKEAIKKLLVVQDSGYLSAPEAIEEAFDDIRAHQFSMVAGMQTALLELLKRFDPQKLEQQVQEKKPISFKIPIYKQAKLWCSFKDVYDEIESDASDNFYQLFGQVFAETYEQQINRLKTYNKESSP